MESELKRLASVYGVYSQYADAVRQYSNQLWSELDVGRMTDGMQEVGGRLPVRALIREHHASGYASCRHGVTMQHTPL